MLLQSVNLRLFRIYMHRLLGFWYDWLALGVFFRPEVVVFCFLGFNTLRIMFRQIRIIPTYFALMSHKTRLTPQTQFTRFIVFFTVLNIVFLSRSTSFSPVLNQACHVSGRVHFLSLPFIVFRNFFKGIFGLFDSSLLLFWVISFFILIFVRNGFIEVSEQIWAHGSHIRPPLNFFPLLFLIIIWVIWILWSFYFGVNLSIFQICMGGLWNFWVVFILIVFNFLLFFSLFI